MYCIRRFVTTGSKQFRQVLKVKATRPKCTTAIDTPPLHHNEFSRFTIPKDVVGQPTYHSHPHLVSEGHLTYGITQVEYKNRRDTLVSKLASEVDNVYNNHVIVIPAAPRQYMSTNIPYAFRQNSDFFYLTGCLEPSAILVLLKWARSDSYKSILFVHEKDSHANLWEDPWTGCSAAVQLFAVDEALPVDTFNIYLDKIATHTKPAILWYHSKNPANCYLKLTIRSLLKHDQGITLSDPLKALNFMRLFKSPAEIELMKETCYIGSQAMNTAMACTQPGISEFNVSAVLEYSCRQSGAEHLAFPPTVAGGSRATHIRYISRNQLLQADEMVLVEAGTQRWLYNSDISRTWPVSGKFSKYHRVLYKLVLTVQKRLLKILGEQRPSLDQLVALMYPLLGTHLQQEGILPKNIDSHQLIETAYRLCPHHVSHYLGLDVHDTPAVKRRVPVATNMVFTVGPGIYIRPDDTTVPPEFRGVGIRIEDDVLITDGDPVVLTDTCVKEIDDVEAMVGKYSQ